MCCHLKLIDVALEKIATGKLAYTPIHRSSIKLDSRYGVPSIGTIRSSIGVQIAGGFGREDLLLQLAKQLETERPWANKLPPMISSGQT